MKTMQLTLTLTLIAGLMLAAPLEAQPGRFYDPKNVVTVQGQVEKIENRDRPGRRGGDQGTPSRQIQIMHLKTDQGVMRVHLGPTSFLEQQQFAPKTGDSLSVTGSKLSTGRGNVLLAAEVQYGGKTLTLRDAQGVPVWQGQGRRGRQRIISPQPPGPAPPQ